MRSVLLAMVLLAPLTGTAVGVPGAADGGQRTGGASGLDSALVAGRDSSGTVTVRPAPLSAPTAPEAPAAPARPPTPSPSPTATPTPAPDPFADPQLERGWPAYAFSGAGTYHAGPNINALVGDIDGDPQLEVLAQGTAVGPVYAFDHDGTPIEGWPDRSSTGTGYPTLGDLTPGSGRGLDVVMSYWPWPQSRITAKRGDGSVLPGRWPEALAMSPSAPVVTDVNGDGVDDVVARMYNDTVILDRYGNEVPWWHPTSASYMWREPTVADLDGDGRKEIISYGPSFENVIVQVWRWDGSFFPGFPLVLPSQYALADDFVSVGDVTGDGRPDLVFTTAAINHGPALAHVIDPLTLAQRTMTGYSGVAYSAEPALADLDGDGTLDVVVQTEHGLDAWHGDGTPLPGFPLPIGDPYYGQKASGDPVVGDVDGDQRPDIVLVAKSADLNTGRVYAFDAQGRTLAGFPKSTDGAWDFGMPAIADIDLDGRNEIIAVGQRLDYVEQKPTVWVWDLGGGPDGPVQWGQHKGGPRHEGVAGAPAAPPPLPAPQGTPATGTLSPVADIAPGGDGSVPRDVVPFGDGVAFSAWRPDVGRELFVSDGTAAGTRLVADIAPGPAGSGVRELAVAGDALYFVADDGVAGAELWRSDGTAAGTRRVADVRPGPRGSRPEWVTAFAAGVYFSADDGASGRELWRSDGTAAGTVLVADLKPGRLGGEPKDLVVYGGSLYFLGYNQYLASDGYIEARQFLQRLDEGGAPVFFVNAALNSGAYGEPDYGHVAWSAPLVTDGRTIWSVAGGAAQQLCTAEGYDAEPFYTEVAQIGPVTGGAAWTLLANCGTTLAPAGSPPPVAPRGLAGLAGQTWFAGTSADTGRELWSGDGTAAGTRLRNDLRPGAGGSDPTDITADRVRLLLSADADGRGREPWQVRPDGTAAGVADLWPGPGGSSPRGLVRSGTRWYFVADDPASGTELWSAPIETVAPTVTGTVPALVRGTVTATVAATDDLTPAPSLALACRVDARAWAACGPTYTATGLSTGTHTVTAQAIDQSGNVGTWTATFRSDVTPPAVPAFSAPTASTYLTSPVTYSYRSTDVGSTVASYDLRYRVATPTSGFSGYITPSGWAGRTSTSVPVGLSPGQEVCVSARARDAAGNVSAWSADRCTGMPLDDWSLSPSSGWTRTTGTAYFRGTATTTRTYAATLSKAGVTARRIAIVATTCPTCGSVSVYLGGVYVGAVSLTSSTTAYRRVLALPLLAANRTGTLLLRTRSTAFVAIDGVALRRT